MEFITQETVEAWTKVDTYYTNRWMVFFKEIEILKRKKFNNALELGPGPNGKSIIIGATTIGQAKCDLNCDARKTPWPFENKQFDIALALQVFEHLDGGQRVVYRELRRVAKSVLITVPLDWDYDMYHIVNLPMAWGWFDCAIPTEFHYWRDCFPAFKRCAFYFEDANEFATDQRSVKQ